MGDVNLDGEQLERVHDALMDAFPTPGDLERLVRFGLSENVHEVATGTLNEVAFGLLRWSEARGCTRKLLAAACVRNPGNPKLARVAAEFVSQRAPQTPTGEAPVADLLSDPELRRSLGLSDEDARVDARVKQVVADVAAVLEKHPVVATALARQMKVNAAPGNFANVVAEEVVVRRRAKDVAMALNHVDDRLAKDDAEVKDRSAVRNLLWRVLPLTIDWRQTVVLGRAALREGPGAVELPLRSGTIAEVVIAGIDDRCCRFAPFESDAMPVGAALVGLPAAAQTALIDLDGSLLAQAVVQKLAAEMHVEKLYTKYPDLRAAVEGSLQYFAREAPEDELLPYYLLFDDAVLPGSNNAQALWMLMRKALGDELPSLRLVRLTGGALAEEVTLARHIQAILKRVL